MTNIAAYAALAPKKALEPFKITRREPGPHDVQIEILFSGVCHSDIHQAREDWGKALFPMVPGHEIVGKVSKVGASVKKYREGDLVGVGCFVDSCRTCESCKEGLEQYCEQGSTFTYNGVERDGKTPTFGGYSTRIVVNEDYVVRVSSKIPLHQAAPLLCAGITTYSPLRHWGVKKGQKVGVLGLGGLGHMAVKFAAAMGAEVTVFSTSESKRADAKRLGATDFVITKDPTVFAKLANRFDLIIDAVSAKHDLAPYLSCLRRDGNMVLLGVPDEASPLHPFPLIMGRRKLGGSLIGGIKETQEMLDFCAEKGIGADVEVIQMKDINEAYERMIRGDVKYRFVIDIAASFK